jgi:hypothetical protein
VTNTSGRLSIRPDHWPGPAVWPKCDLASKHSFGCARVCSRAVLMRQPNSFDLSILRGSSFTGGWMIRWQTCVWRVGMLTANGRRVSRSPSDHSAVSLYLPFRSISMGSDELKMPSNVAGGWSVPRYIQGCKAHVHRASGVLVWSILRVIDRLTPKCNKN